MWRILEGHTLLTRVCCVHADVYQGNNVNNSVAFKALLEGVTVLVDEEGVADGRLATKETFMQNYGFTEEDVTSGLYPFLTYGARPASMRVGLVLNRCMTFR